MFAKHFIDDNESKVFTGLPLELVFVVFVNVFILCNKYLA